MFLHAKTNEFLKKKKGPDMMRCAGWRPAHLAEEPAC